MPTHNTIKTLSDGAWLIVTTALDGDRTGHTYERAIAADDFVQADWTQLDTAKDPVLQAATAWLRAQRECRS